MSALRSSNRTTPRKHYNNDPFEGIESLRSVSPIENRRREPAASRNKNGDSSESDAVLSDSDGEDDMSGVEDIESNEEPRLVTTPALKVRQRVRHAMPTPDVPMHIRGVSDNTVRISSTERRIYLFGRCREDYDAVVKARDRWGHESCFPSRQTKQSGQGGFTYSQAYQNQIVNAEFNWKWFNQDGGKAAFLTRQTTKPVERLEAYRHLAADAISARTVVLGAIGQQKLNTLQHGATVSLSEAFEQEPQPGQTWKVMKSPDYKSGFLINLGARVNALDWAPNQFGLKQYLAVSILSKREEDHPPFQAPKAPAYTPQEKLDSGIQIWAVVAKENGFVDKTIAPKLHTLICTSIGDVKALKWCPVPLQQDELGLLACIGGDGAVRVINVGSLVNDGTNTRLETFAFESRPPNTVCTSLTWLSSTRLAASCANGCTAIWDLASASASNSPNPRPSTYTNTSLSYILSHTSAWPSFPDMVMSTSMTGFLTLTDYASSSPSTATGAVHAPQARVAQPLLVWSDFTKCAISVEDNLQILAYPLRRWYKPLSLGRIKSQATSIAVSPCHPFLLIGTAGGEVVGLNPICPIVDGGRVGLWTQEWFRHEWRREREDGEENVEAAKERGGLSRIVEGFKAEKMDMGRHASRTASNMRNGVRFKTIYEEKTAITAVAWNPNLHVAGWAAAGMADGLLRVEDVAA